MATHTKQELKAIAETLYDKGHINLYLPLERQYYMLTNWLIHNPNNSDAVIYHEFLSKVMAIEQFEKMYNRVPSSHGQLNTFIKLGTCPISEDDGMEALTKDDLLYKREKEADKPYCDETMTNNVYVFCETAYKPSEEDVISYLSKADVQCQDHTVCITACDDPLDKSRFSNVKSDDIVVFWKKTLQTHHII